MGMADGLSLSLRNAGFQVSDYLPYGPVEQIIPYLIRRAKENKGLLSTSSFDRHLLRYGRPSGIYLLQDTPIDVNCVI